MRCRFTMTILVVALVASLRTGTGSAHCIVDLQVTELWAGGLPGAEATSDWFEVTNFGSLPACGLDGNIYFDDSSADPTASDPMTGIDQIRPGESVVYLTAWEDDFNNDSESAKAAFTAMWGPISDLQVGVVILGSGLGANGDAANIFDANTDDASLIDGVTYVGTATVASYVSEVDGTWHGRLAEVGVLGAREGNLPAHDLGPEPPIGSPGTAGRIPEPTSGLLFSFGGLLLWHVRRRTAAYGTGRCPNGAN